MLADSAYKISKLFAILCIGIVFALGISCHVHASPHTHGSPSSHHDDDHHHGSNASSTLDDVACLVADIPVTELRLELRALQHDSLVPVIKPLTPSFEFYRPPRSSL